MEKKRYQGREFNISLKAPDKTELEKMVRGVRAYAHRHGMEKIEVIRKGKDPDGGWEAIVVAHNWNPLKWIGEKWEARGGGYEARMERAEEKAERERRKAGQEAEEAETRMLKSRTKTKELIVETEQKRAKLARKQAKEALGEKSLVEQIGGFFGGEPASLGETQRVRGVKRVKRSKARRKVTCPVCQTSLICPRV